MYWGAIGCFAHVIYDMPFEIIFYLDIEVPIISSEYVKIGPLSLKSYLDSFSI